MQQQHCCPVLGPAALDEEQALGLAGAQKVLADPARLQLVSLIATSPSGEACVCNLTAPLGLSQPTVSHHLKVPSESGVLIREKRGRWVFYRVNEYPLQLLSQALTKMRPSKGTVATFR